MRAAGEQRREQPVVRSFSDPTARRALNEQVKALESWRKTALEREREREHERALWSSSPHTTRSKREGPDTSIASAKTASGVDECQKEASLRGARAGTRGWARAGDERQNEYYYVAHALRNNIRARVREELGQGKRLAGPPCGGSVLRHDGFGRCFEEGNSDVLTCSASTELEERIRQRGATNVGASLVEGTATAKENDNLLASDVETVRAPDTIPGVDVLFSRMKSAISIDSVAG